jgi:hypothetical protein
MRKWGKINFAKIVCVAAGFSFTFHATAAVIRAHVAYRFHIKRYFQNIFLSLTFVTV